MSARADAVHALSNGYKEFEHVLRNLSQDISQTPETRVAAVGLSKQLGQFDTAFLTVLWNDLLMRIDQVSSSLQKEELDFLGAVKQLQTLKMYLEEKRDNFDYYENAATKLCGIQAANYKRNRKLTLFADEKRESFVTNMDPKTRFRTEVFLTIVDNLRTQLDTRTQSYASLGERFELFHNFKDKEPETIKTQADRIALFYCNDVDMDSFGEECLHFKQFLKIDSIERLRDAYKYLRSPETSIVSNFPNLEVALRIYLTLPLTNCSAERGFSALKRVKSVTWSTLEQTKLNHLMIMCTESEVTLKMNFDDVINDFAEKM